MQNDDKKQTVNRRDFLRKAGAIGLAGFAGTKALNAVADTNKERVITAPDQPNPPIITQNFPIAGNDDRPIVQYPEKRPLIRVTSRPPQLETPMNMLADAEGCEGALTANDAFFVRYHNSVIPLSIDPNTHTLSIQVQLDGSAYIQPDYKTGSPEGGSPTKTVLTLTMKDLQTKFEDFSIVAVNQCSGNSRGFENPRMPGGQLGNGTVGCARWTGVRLKDVLAMAGIDSTAQQVIFNGLDNPDDEPPDFVKAIPYSKAINGEVMLAYAMNGEELPMLNGYPLKLIVPGWFGTYHVKHLSEIIISYSNDMSGMFYMGSAYRIPNNGTGYIAPGTSWPPATGAPTPPWIPINRLKIRSFITSHLEGAKVHTGRPVRVKGIAFDGGDGIKMVEFSSDGGLTWAEAKLGKDFGKYAFRPWTIRFTPPADGAYVLQVRATSNTNETQPADPAMCWNPNGYMRNVIETVNVTAVSTLGDSDD